jgi:hypothetical protein
MLCGPSTDQLWARSARRMIAQARLVGWRARLSLFSSTTTLAPKMAYSSSRRTHWYSSAGGRSRAGRKSGLRAANTRSSGGATGWPPRWRAAAMARWRMASGSRVGMPRPLRAKALRSDGHVVPSWAAAALTLPSRSARAKARSASARSERKRLGCQPGGPPHFLEGGRPLDVTVLLPRALFIGYGCTACRRANVWVLSSVSRRANAREEV